MRSQVGDDGRAALEKEGGARAGALPAPLALAPGGAADVTLLVARTASVSGRLQDDRGAPLAGFFDRG